MTETEFGKSFIIMRRQKPESSSSQVPYVRPRSPRVSTSFSQIIENLSSSGLVVKPVNIKDANQTRHICRVCLKNGDIPIYGDRHFVNICEDLMTFGGIKVRPEDAYPKYLCQSCRGLLEGAVAFRKTAQQSDKVLRQPIKKESILVNLRNHVTNFDSQMENESGIIPDWDDNLIPYKHTKSEIDSKASENENMVSKRIMNFEYETRVQIERETGKITTKPFNKTSHDTALKLDDTMKSKQVGDNEESHSIISILNKTYNLIDDDDGRKFVGTRIINSNYQLVEDKEYDTQNTVTFDNGAYKYNAEDVNNHIVGKRILNSEFTMLEENEKADGVYRCKDCDLVFGTKEMLKEHKRSEKHRKRKVPCPDCNQMYSACSVRHHILLHKEAKFMCDICGKNFTTHTNFYNHRLMHTTVEKKFKCELCDYRCRFKEYLRIHMRTHSERPYHCPHCPNRSFINTGNLNRHMLTNHKEERDFRCEVCDKGFYTKRELDVHIDAVHLGLTHACSYCGKLYSYLRSMRHHELMVHKRNNKAEMKRQNEIVLLSNME